MEVKNISNFWEGFKNYKSFPYSQLEDFSKHVVLSLPDDTNIATSPEYKYAAYNIPVSFDIETSSWSDEYGKHATMYLWQFGLNGSVIYGRTWDEFFNLMLFLDEKLYLSKDLHLIIYVHNLGYEFQWFCKYFQWDKVFALKQRRPIQAICGGFEFRCSYLLSNYNLAYIGDNLLTKYQITKKVGDLDYSLIRHSKTPLSEKELTYGIDDVRVVMSYIQEKIEQEGSILELPLTNTGYVRRFCRYQCFFANKASNRIDASQLSEKDPVFAKKAYKAYHKLMHSLQLTNNEYFSLKNAFAGGFTHASALHSGLVNYNVGSADLASSYPFSMVALYYPMSRGHFIGNVNSEKLFENYLKKYCCLFTIQFCHIRPKVVYENIISYSHCTIEGNYSLNNGRVISASRLTTTITELDYDSISKFYEWDSYKVVNMWVYDRAYLPKQLILAILELYKNKTTLKGIAEKVVEYMVSKNMINAAYGMAVTAIIRDDHEFTGTYWEKTKANYSLQLNNYNNNKKRFLSYAWGVWVTAHARHNLFSAILEFKEDYIYADTDSIKGINFESHLDYFKRYNRNVKISLLKMCETYKIPFEMCKPSTIKGEKKYIGVWEFEDSYSRFKTVGAKRYIYQYEKNGFVTFTVAGVNKTSAMPYLISIWNNIDTESEEFRTIQLAYKGDKKAFSRLLESNYDYDMIFNEFGEGMYIPKEYTSKNTVTYIDTEDSGLVTDYLGEESPYHELSSVHMEPQHYYMSQLKQYLDYLKGIQEIYY